MDIQFPQILFQLINFGTVAGVLTFLLFKPIKKMLDDRSNRVEEAQKAAELTLAEKKNIDEMKKKAQKDAEKQAATLLEEATKDVQNRRKDLMLQAKREAAAEYEKILQSAQEEKQAMMKAAQQQFEEAVFAAVERVIGAVDKKTHTKLIDAELENVLKHI